MLGAGLRVPRGRAAGGRPRADEVGRAELIGDDAPARFTGSGAMNAQLDLDCGILEPIDLEGRVPLSDDWIGYLQPQIDSDLLDLLHDDGFAPRAGPRPRSTGGPALPTSPWPGGRRTPMLHDRYLDHADEGRCFIAHDLYCVNPACACSEVLIEFAPVKHADKNVGSIRVRFPDLEVVERVVTPNEEGLLDRLWSAFVARHPHFAERCVRRRQRMVELAACRASARTPVARAAGRVGRNEPCSCGSGKNYKRCCGL